MFHNELKKKEDQILYDAFAAGVGQMLLIAVDSESARYSLDLCRKHRGSLYSMVNHGSLSDFSG